MHTVLDFFLHFLPLEYFKTTILQAANETLLNPLTWGEFLRFMAILFSLRRHWQFQDECFGQMTRQTYFVVPHFICMLTCPDNVLRRF